MALKLTKTVTSIFMVPTLSIGQDNLMNNGFINGYYKDSQRDVQYEDAIYILFKPKHLDKFRVFLDKEYERTKAIIDDYDYPDGFVVIVYQLDPKFKLDFELIRQGDFTKTSKEFQSLFSKHVVLTNSKGSKVNQLSLQYKVFNKTKEMVEFWERELNIVIEKNQELWNKYFDEKETLTIDKLNNYVQQ